MKTHVKFSPRGAHSSSARPWIALAALASLSMGVVVPAARAQNANTDTLRPLVPLAGEGVSNPGFTSVRVSPEEFAALLRAMDQRDHMTAFKPQGASSGTGTGKSGNISAFASGIINTTLKWVPTGPVGLNPGDTASANGVGQYPLAGRVNQVAWDPTRPDVLYIATASGGVWRATIDYSLGGDPQPGKAITDAVLATGVQPLADFAFPTLATSCVAINPSNPRIVYVGTGDFDGSTTGQAGVGVGIMKTVNDGRTWIKIADRDPVTGAAIMEGACVSTLVIDPNNVRRLVAATGRGSTPGSLWISEDEGNNWRKPVFKDASGNTIAAPTGDWSSIDYSALRADRTRTWYAARIGDGIYRSDDAGLTWRRLASVPINLNGKVGGGWGLEVAASKVTSGADNVYVMDGSSSISTGFFYKSTDRGVTWVTVTNPYPFGNNGNWGTVYSASTLYTGIVPVSIVVNGSPISDTSNAREILFGGTRRLSANESVGVRTTLTGTIYGGALDTGIGLTWTNISDITFPFFSFLTTPINHLDQHTVAQRPGSIGGGTAYFATGSEGGVAGLNYSQGQASPTAITTGSWAWDILDINSNLTVQPIVDGDFFLLPNGQMRFLGGSNYLGTPRLQANLSSSFLDLASAWDTLPISGPVTIFDPGNGRNVTLDDTNTAPPAGATTFTKTVNGTFFANNLGPYVSTAAYDESVSSGNTSYVMVNGGDNWPSKRLYWTFDNWNTALDISPDRYRLNGIGNKLTTPDYTNGIFVYSSTDPQATATGTDWTGSTKPAFGQKAAMKVFGGKLLVGTSALWRFDTPGTFGALPGITSPAPYPNKDYGQWRRVGNANITTTGYITAMDGTDLRNLYVGTSNGEVYVSQNATDQDTTTPIPNITATWTKLNTPAEWIGHPITALTLNRGAANANLVFRDVTVTLGGSATGTYLPRVWNNPNTLANIGSSVFVAKVGLGQVAGQLPDVPVNAFARDPDDPYGTFFVATDIGMFTTSDGGSTWTNATAPLGLPNVKCVAAEVQELKDRFGNVIQKWLMVATNGRGVWRFNLKNLAPAVTNPVITTNLTINRINGELVTTVSVTNTGGPAYNVQLEPVTRTDANGKVVAPSPTNITVNGVAYVSSSFPVTNGVPQPISLGLLGNGQTQTVTLRYSGSSLRPGALATYRIGGSYLTPPLPPGTAGSFNNGSGTLLRIP